MDLPAPPRLVDNAAFTMVLSLWYEDDYVRMIFGHYQDESRRNIVEDPGCIESPKKCLWDKIIFNFQTHSNMVIEKLNSLPLPHHLIQLLIDYVQPVGNELMNCLRPITRLYNDLELAQSIKEMIVWNVQFAVDFKRTVERIIETDIDVVDQFRIACIFCIDCTVHELFPVVSHHFSNFDQPDSEHLMVIFWVCYLRENMRPVYLLTESAVYECPEQLGLWLAITYDNVTAQDYFLTKIPVSKRVDVARSFFNHAEFAKNFVMIPALFKWLDPVERDECLKQRPVPVISAFLQWPQRSTFLPIMTQVVQYLSEKGFYHIVANFSLILNKFSKSSIYEEFFRKFWLSGSLALRRYVIRKCVTSFFLNQLVAPKSDSREVIIQCILETASASERKAIFHSSSGIAFIELLARRRRWKCLVSFLDQCLTLESRKEWIRELLFILLHRDDFLSGRIYPPLNDELQSTLIRVITDLEEKKGIELEF